MALSDFITDTSVQSKRTALADAHITARSDGENNFYGFTSTSGFTTDTATSMGQLITKLTALTTTSNVVIKCQWNGVSSSASRAFITNASGLTANGAVDWGYNRPNCKVQIIPDTGYTPILQGTFNSGGNNTFEIDGAHWIEFKNLQFQGCITDFRRSATFPGTAMAAFNGCTFKDCTDGALKAVTARSIHTADCVFDNCQSGIIGAAEFRRMWRNVFVNHRNDDINGIRDYIGFAVNWTAHSWLFGNFVYNMSTINLGTAVHTDFGQIDHKSGTDTDNPAVYSTLSEFNIADLNNATYNGDTQFHFGNTSEAWDGEWCVHNNIALINAYHAAMMADANDNAHKYVYRNMFIPAGNRGDTANTPWVRGNRLTAGTGSLNVSENYLWDDASNTGRVNGENFTGNRHVDFATGAASGDRPENLFTFGVGFGTNANGHRSYDFGTTGMSKVAARAQILANLKPLGGWRANNYGPVNPDLFPVDPLTLAVGAPNVGDKITLNLTVA